MNEQSKKKKQLYSERKSHVRENIQYVIKPIISQSLDMMESDISAYC